MSRSGPRASPQDRQAGAAIGPPGVRAGASRRPAGLAWLVFSLEHRPALLIVAGGILLNVGGFLAECRAVWRTRFIRGRRRPA